MIHVFVYIDKEQNYCC